MSRSALRLAASDSNFEATGTSVPPPQSVPLGDRLLWSLDEIRSLTGLSRRTLERERSSGRFPQPDVRVGRRALYRPQTVRDWLDQQTTK
jgi:predicted DNA-binding transcriptional regulator AlpA